MELSSIEEALKVDVASRLAPSIRLASIGILQLSAGYIAADRDQEHLRYDLPTVQVAWRLQGDLVDAQFPFVIDISSGKDEPQPLARVSVTIYITYSGATAFSPVELRHFVGLSGFMHAWPYLRAEVQGLTAKVGLPPLLLPLILSGAVPDKVSIGEPLVEAAESTPSRVKSPRTKRTKVPAKKTKRKR